MFNRESVIRFLLRRPGALQSRIARWTVLVLAGIGGAFLVWSAVIHLELWSDGYKDISVIGPLFLVQGIVNIILGVAVVAFRWLALLLAGAVAGVATAVGLLLSVYVGLFGYTESLSVPYADAVPRRRVHRCLRPTGRRGAARPRHADPVGWQAVTGAGEVSGRMGTVGTSGERQPDEVLLAGLGAGDAELAVAFVRRFQRIVFGVAVAVIGNPVTAEDVAQQAFEQAWRHASVYDPRRGSVRAWLTTITHNLAINLVRARSAQPMDPNDLPVLLAAMTDSPERMAVANDSAQGLRQALSRLPVPQARAVAMSGIYGMTARQVAGTEGIPLGTAKTRIRDGMQKLRAAFLPEEAGDE